MGIKHRERVQIALNHEQPDRCPMQISFTPEFAKRLCEDIGFSEKQIHNPHGGGNTYLLETYLEQDLLLSSIGWANCYYQDSDRYTDEWGVGWKSVKYQTKFGCGKYTEICQHPLSQDKAIDTYIPPDPNRDKLYEGTRSLIEKYKQEYWIVGVTVTTIFETAWALRGLEKMLMDLVMNPEFAKRILDIPFNYHLTVAIRLVEIGVDMIWIGDDVGTQQGMLISPELWRHHFKPRLKKFIGTLKDINPEIKIAYHCDGDIYPIVEDLIEIGLDVLNPVQPKCIDPALIKEEFGKKLCFWGSIDEQYTLPFGSEEDVKKEVINRMKTIGKNGGLIIGPTHHVQLDTPLDNFWAMVNAIKDGY